MAGADRAGGCYAVFSLDMIKEFISQLQVCGTASDLIEGSEDALSRVLASARARLVKLLISECWTVRA